MNNLTLLFHVLGAIVAVGMLVPDLLLGRIFREAADDGEKIRLARLHLRFGIAATFGLVLIVFTGVGRTFEVPYPWFSFRDALWLAIKQILGIALLILRLSILPGTLRLHKALGHSDPAALKSYEGVRGRSQHTLGIALILAILGVLKPG